MIRTTGTSGISNMNLKSTTFRVNSEKINSANNNARTEDIVTSDFNYGCGSVSYGCGSSINSTMSSEALNSTYDPWSDPEYVRKYCEEIQRENERINAEVEEDFTFFGSIVDTVVGYGKDISDAYDTLIDNTSDFLLEVEDTVNDIGGYISDTYDTIIDSTSDFFLEVEETVDDIGDFISDTYDTIIDKTSDFIVAVDEKIDEIKEELDLFLECLEENVKKVNATISNAVISVGKGVLRAVEGIGDAAASVCGFIASGYTNLYDAAHYFFTGEFSNETEKWTKKYTDLVAENWVDDLGEVTEYYTGIEREDIDKYSYDFFDSDGTGSKICEGVGETGAIVLMAVGTGGVGPGALSIAGGTVGVGKHTEEAYAEQKEQNVQQEAYRRIQNIEITQEMYDEKLSQMKLREDREYTQEEVLNEIFNDLFAKEVNAVKSEGGYDTLSPLQANKGLTYGISSGIIDGVQWYLGGKINTLSPFTSRAANIATRVSLDTVDAMSEVPIRTELKTLYREDIEGKRMSYSQLWDKDGGNTQLLVQGVLGFGGSLFGESIELFTSRNKIQLDTSRVEKKLTIDASAQLSSKEITSIETARKQLGMEGASNLDVAKEVNRITKSLDFDKIDLKKLDLATMKQLDSALNGVENNAKKNILNKLTKENVNLNPAFTKEYNKTMEELSNSVTYKEFTYLDKNIKTNVEDFMKKRIKDSYGMNVSSFDSKKLYDVYSSIEDSVDTKKVLSLGNLDNELSRINPASLDEYTKFFKNDIEISADTIKNTNLKTLSEKIDFDNMDENIKQIMDERIIKEQDQIYDRLLNEYSFSSIRKYVNNNPELLSKLKTDNLVRLAGFGGEFGETVLNELERRIKNGEMIFNVTPIEKIGFFGSEGYDTYNLMLKLNNYDENLYSTVREMYYSNYKKYIPTEINDLLKLDDKVLYSKMGIATLFENNRIDETGIKILKSMQGNDSLISNFDYRMLDKDIINDFGESFVKDIGKYSDYSGKIISLRESNPKVYKALTAMINNAQLDDSLRGSTNSIKNAINYMFYNSNALEEGIEHINLSSLQNYINIQKRFENSFKNNILPAFSNDFMVELSEMNYAKVQSIKDTVSKLSNDGLINLYSHDLKEIYYLEFFQSDEMTIKKIVNSYGNNIEYLEKNLLNPENQKYVDMIKFIKDFESLNDTRTLIDLFDNQKVRITAEELTAMEEALREEYVNSYLSAFKSTNEYVAKNSNTIMFNGKEIKVVDMNDDFSLLVHSSDTGFKGDKELINNSFKDTISYTNNLKTHGLSTSFITQDNIGSAPVGKNGVLFGFSDMDNVDIQGIGVSDINSNIANYGFTSNGVQEFVPANQMSSRTLRLYNEVVLNRDTVTPSCVVLYSDASEDVINNSFKAAAEMDIPVVKIDVDSLAQKQISNAYSSLDMFKQSGDMSYIKDAINKYETSISGFNLNATQAEEAFSNVHTSVNKYYDLNKYESTLTDIAHSLKEKGVQSDIDKFVDCVVDIQNKYKVLNDIRSPITATKTSINYDNVLKELLVNE